MRSRIAVALSLLFLIVAAIGSTSPTFGQGEWTELVATHASIWGMPKWVTRPRWHRVAYDAYRGCYSASSCAYYPYEPTSGPDANWWKPEYDDSGWSNRAYVYWDSWWASAWPPIPAVGRVAFRAGERSQNGATDLHRRWFSIPDGYAITAARLWVFSDNHSRWYVNGTFVRQHVGSGYWVYDVPVGLLHSGDNLLAVQINNDNVCWDCNPFGLQYLLEASLLPAPPELDVGPACAGGMGRTVTWGTMSGLEYQVEAARDADFTVDLRTSSWTAEDTYAFTGLDEGMWYYHIRARDGVNTGEWGEVGSAVQDLSPPSTAASPSGSVGSGGWWRSDVEVELPAVDTGCGLAGTEYQADGGGWQTYTGCFTIGGDGTHTVEYRSTDVVGNAEATQVLVLPIDGTAPSTAPDLRGREGLNGWYRSAVGVTLIASDATSGVDQTRYRVDGTPWLTYTVPFTISGDGAHVLGYSSVDTAGNEEELQSLQVDVDTLPPATTPVLSGTLGLNGWYTDAVTAAIGAADATSGVSSSYLAGAVVTAPLVYTADGTYVLPYRSVDVAGNAEPTQTVSFGLDTVPPDAGVTSSSFCPTCGEQLQIHLAAEDSTSGLNGWRLRFLGGVDQEWSGSGSPPDQVSWNGEDGSGALVSPGTYELVLWVQDGAGWTVAAGSRAQVRPAPQSPTPPPAPPLPPAATSTPVPAWTPVPTMPLPPTSTPDSEEGRTVVPSPTPILREAEGEPLPSPTPGPGAQVVSEPASASATLRVVIFRDDDTNAQKANREPGLVGLRVRAQGRGDWSAVFTADVAGMITATLPGSGIYLFYLADRPGLPWRATTRTALEVEVMRDGMVRVLPAERKGKPVGVAEGALFAIGLVGRPMLWLPLAGVAMLLLTGLTAVLDRRAAAILDLERAIGGVK